MSAAVVPIAGGDECERLYRAWRYARARWELADNAPERPDGLTNEEDAQFCDADHAALMAFMLHPAADAIQLSRKLATFRDEEGWDFSQAREIIDQFCRDARFIAYPNRTE